MSETVKVQGIKVLDIKMPRLVTGQPSKVVDSKTFAMNTNTAMYPDEFYSYVNDLQEQLAEGKVDKIVIEREEVLTWKSGK